MAMGNLFLRTAGIEQVCKLMQIVSDRNARSYACSAFDYGFNVLM
jgi:hypothetical protein